MLSVVRSCLIDVHSHSDSRCHSGSKGDEKDRNKRSSTPSSKAILTKTDSAYKALVSVFCWATVSDPLVKNWTSTVKATKKAKKQNAWDDPDWADWSKEDMRHVQDIQDVVMCDSWPDRGIKGMREFLMGLGVGNGGSDGKGEEFRFYVGSDVNLL